MNLQGKLIKIFETKVITEKFQKREFVIETGGDYPQTISMEFHNETS